MPTALILNLHGIDYERLSMLRAADIQERRYIISRHMYHQIIHLIQPKKCCSVASLMDATSGNWYVLTFDDGLVSDYEVAFPALLENGLKATFFVTASNVGEEGYVSRAQLKEMAAAGMEIGSHGITHNYLTEMPRQRAAMEITKSKEMIEDIIGSEVVSFTAVGGHYNSWMIEEAQTAGYKAFGTTAPGKTYVKGTPALLRRNHILAHYREADIVRLLDQKLFTLFLSSMRYRFLQAPKTALGLRNYDKLKSLLLSVKPFASSD